MIESRQVGAGQAQSRIERILTFWFDEAGPKAWYAVDPAFDLRLRRSFASWVEEEARRAENADHPWLDTAEGALALILLFDQFPRNIWRGSGHAFAHDEKARKAAESAIEAGHDLAFEEDQRRAFFYMPFMHSEAMEDQDRCVALAGERLGETSTLHHAVKHREVIERFGRFPFRNEALGREMTAEERAYLAWGGYAPGSRKGSRKASGTGRKKDGAE